MTASINAISGGAGGLACKGDTSGALNIQTASTTAIAIDASQNVSIPQNLTVTGATTAATIKSTSVNTPTTFQDSAGTQIGTLCRAWVNFGYVSSAITVRASFNVSGVTRASAGTYTVNFTNSLPDANYSVCFGNVGAGSTNLTVTTVLQGSYITGATAKTAASVGIYTGSSSSASSTPLDVADVSVNIFR